MPSRGETSRNKVLGRQKIRGIRLGGEPAAFGVEVNLVAAARLCEPREIGPCVALASIEFRPPGEWHFDVAAGINEAHRCGIELATHSRGADERREIDSSFHRRSVEAAIDF